MKVGKVLDLLMRLSMSENKFTFKKQSNGLYSVSIHKTLKPKWKYKNLTKNQLSEAQQKYNNAMEQLFKGEYLICNN